MDHLTLQRWLDDPRLTLVAAVAEDVIGHVAGLRSRGIEFYGYALLPGEPYDIHSLVAVTNSEADIKVPADDDLYSYYRYSVDEWAYWDRDGFAASNMLLNEANAQFKAMHTKADDEFVMDEFEIAHANGLLNAIVRGLETAKQSGAFGSANPFLVVWISDSGHEIMVKSVRRLNSELVADEFLADFG